MLADISTGDTSPNKLQWVGSLGVSSGLHLIHFIVWVGSLGVSSGLHLIHFIVFLIMCQIAYIRRARKSSKHNHSMQTEMPFNCLACGEAVTARQEGIECDGCHCWQHRTCIPNLCRAEYRQACRVGYMDWTCQQCIAIASASVVATAPTTVLLHARHVGHRAGVHPSRLVGLQTAGSKEQRCRGVE